MTDQPKQPKEKKCKCPICDYCAVTPSLLQRHLNQKHAEVNGSPGQLLAALGDKKTVPEMLNSVAKWIEEGTTFDEKLPEDVITYLKKEDAKIQLILRVIAVEKVQRAFELAEKIREFHAAFSEKVKDPKFKDNADANTYLSLIERMQGLQREELDFLKQISQLGNVNLSDVVDKLVLAFGTSRMGQLKPGATAFQLTGIHMPDDPAEREQLRNILRHIGVEGNGKPGNADKSTEAEFTEGAGSDPEGDKEE